ncbi:mCG1040791, isoform CRA_b, partial [Mus musculus]
GPAWSHRTVLSNLSSANEEQCCKFPRKQRRKYLSQQLLQGRNCCLYLKRSGELKCLSRGESLIFSARFQHLSANCNH